MSEFIQTVTNIVAGTSGKPKEQIIDELVRVSEREGYHIADVNSSKPWGGFLRYEYSDAEKFVKEFFIDTSLEKLRIGGATNEISPKLLLITPGQRLSWQYHDRRAERWHFLTPGGYVRSDDDQEPTDVTWAERGEIVQFDASERHRAYGQIEGSDYCLIAEIWQHTDKDNPSDEDDIYRLADDYKR